MSVVVGRRQSSSVIVSCHQSSSVHSRRPSLSVILCRCLRLSIVVVVVVCSRPQQLSSVVHCPQSLSVIVHCCPQSSSVVHSRCPCLPSSFGRRSSSSVVVHSRHRSSTVVVHRLPSLSVVVWSLSVVVRCRSVVVRRCPLSSTVVIGRPQLLSVVYRRCPSLFGHRPLSSVVIHSRHRSSTVVVRRPRSSSITYCRRPQSSSVVVYSHPQSSSVVVHSRHPQSSSVVYRRRPPSSSVVRRPRSRRPQLSVVHCHRQSSVVCSRPHRRLVAIGQPMGHDPLALVVENPLRYTCMDRVTYKTFLRTKNQSLSQHHQHENYHAPWPTSSRLKLSCFGLSRVRRHECCEFHWRGVVYLNPALSCDRDWARAVTVIP